MEKDLYTLININYNRVYVKMHLEKQKPKFQIRILEYEEDGITFKKSKNSNIYPNSDNLTFEELWELIKEVVEKK